MLENLVLHQIKINVVADRCKNPDCKHVFSINENTNRLTEKEKAYIKHNVSESVSLRTIARNLKRSLYTVQYFLKK